MTKRLDKMGARLAKMGEKLAEKAKKRAKKIKKIRKKLRSSLVIQINEVFPDGAYIDLVNEGKHPIEIKAISGHCPHIIFSDPKLPKVVETSERLNLRICIPTDNHPKLRINVEFVNLKTQYFNYFSYLLDNPIVNIDEYSKVEKAIFKPKMMATQSSDNKTSYRICGSFTIRNLRL